MCLAGPSLSLAGPSLSAFLRYAHFLASFNWACSCIATLNCCQKLFHFSTSPSKVGILIFGCFMPLVVPRLCGWPIPSLSSCLIGRLRSKKALSRFDSSCSRLWFSCSIERMLQATSESSALRQLTCSCMCCMRQLSRSGPGARDSTVSLVHLKLLSKWCSLVCRSLEGSVAVSRFMTGATTVGDVFVWPSWIRRCMILFILSSWSSNRPCYCSRGSCSRVSWSSSSINSMIW